MNTWRYILMLLALAVVRGERICKWANEGSILTGNDIPLMVQLSLPPGKQTKVIDVPAPECIIHGGKWVGMLARACSADSTIAITGQYQVTVHRSGTAPGDALLEVWVACQNPQEKYHKTMSVPV